MYIGGDPILILCSWFLAVHLHNVTEKLNNIELITLNFHTCSQFLSCNSTKFMRHMKIINFA